MQRLNKDDFKKIMKSLPSFITGLLSSRDDVYLAGGYIRSIIMNTKVNDIDLFCKSQDACDWLNKKITSNYKYSAETLHTKNATTYNTKDGIIQVIHRGFYETPEECLESFDFDMSKACLYNRRRQDGVPFVASLCSDIFYSDLASKRLTYKLNSGNGLNSIYRVLRFVQSGWAIDDKNIDNVLKGYLIDVLSETEASPETIHKLCEDGVGRLRGLYIEEDYPDDNKVKSLDPIKIRDVVVESYDTDIDFELSLK